MAKTLGKTEPTFRRGDLVRVEEEGLTPWEGTVGFPKWSAVSGWWVEVRKEGVGTYIITEGDLTLLAREDG